MGGPPQCIYLIRHAEKPPDPREDDLPATSTGDGPPEDLMGVDVDGTSDPHSLTPRGWQRSGALAVLFTRPPKPGAEALTVPGRLLSPGSTTAAKTEEHRAYQTLLGLSGALPQKIESTYALDQEQQLAEDVLGGTDDAVLVCWEHKRLPLIAAAIPTSTATPPPAQWPGARFDLIWQFRLVDTTPTPVYEFTSLLQDVLGGDQNGSTPT